MLRPILTTSVLSRLISRTMNRFHSQLSTQKSRHPPAHTRRRRYRRRRHKRNRPRHSINKLVPTGTTINRTNNNVTTSKHSIPRRQLRSRLVRQIGSRAQALTLHFDHRTLSPSYPPTLPTSYQSPTIPTSIRLPTIPTPIHPPI